MNKKKKVVNTSIYPDEVIERLARCFYPAILECFNSEEGQRAFAAWQAEQAGLTAKEKQDVYILDIRTASDFFQTRRTFRGAPFSLAVQLVSVAPFAGGETAGFGIAQIYLLGVDHTAAARIRVVFGAATGGDPNHDASSCVGDT